jgi:hypothetical protein
LLWLSKAVSDQEQEHDQEQDTASLPAVEVGRLGWLGSLLFFRKIVGSDFQQKGVRIRKVDRVGNLVILELKGNPVRSQIRLGGLEIGIGRGSESNMPGAIIR